MQEMTGNQKQPNTTYPKDAWIRVGQLLKQHREVDLHERVRRDFANAVQARDLKVTEKTIQQIENAYRSNFSEGLLAEIENAYQLQHGSIRDALEGGDLTPLPAQARPPLTVHTNDVVEPVGYNEEEWMAYWLKRDEQPTEPLRGFTSPHERIVWALDVSWLTRWNMIKILRHDTQPAPTHPYHPHRHDARREG